MDGWPRPTLCPFVCPSVCLSVWQLAPSRVHSPLRQSVDHAERRRVCSVCFGLDFGFGFGTGQARLPCASAQVSARYFCPTRLATLGCSFRFSFGFGSAASTFNFTKLFCLFGFIRLSIWVSRCHFTVRLPLGCRCCCCCCRSHVTCHCVCLLFVCRCK